jgi:hypothetical protein
MRWGDHLELSEEATAGDFIYVPPYVPHQEINGSPNEICEAVVVRSGQAPVVVILTWKRRNLRSPFRGKADVGRGCQLRRHSRQ